MEKDMFESRRVGTNKVQVNLLQFVGDTLFLGEATFLNVIVLEGLLRCFELGFCFMIVICEEIC